MYYQKTYNLHIVVNDIQVTARSNYLFNNMQCYTEESINNCICINDLLENLTKDALVANKSKYLFKGYISLHDSIDSIPHVYNLPFLNAEQFLEKLKFVYKILPKPTDAEVNKLTSRLNNKLRF